VSVGGRPFRAGERVLLVDAKARRYLVTLTEGGTFSTHAGSVPHAALIGQEEGILVRTTHGARLRAVRPTLSDYILKMPRGAQVVYPKDIGPILILADVFPGARVLEAGVGSGALSMALLRAVGPEGVLLG
jgi:tRNA (adenine57-N1/adenine58-N1)-methyltransferase catalytic subunit